MHRQPRDGMKWKGNRTKRKLWTKMIFSERAFLTFQPTAAPQPHYKSTMYNSKTLRRHFNTLLPFHSVMLPKMLQKSWWYVSKVLSLLKKLALLTAFFSCESTLCLVSALFAMVHHLAQFALLIFLCKCAELCTLACRPSTLSAYCQVLCKMFLTLCL